MTDKLDLLKEYISLQANDKSLWLDTNSTYEKYIQQELRKIAYLIEDATEELIKQEITLYKYRLSEE